MVVEEEAAAGVEVTDGTEAVAVAEVEAVAAVDTAAAAAAAVEEEGTSRTGAAEAEGGARTTIAEEEEEEEEEGGETAGEIGPASTFIPTRKVSFSDSIQHCFSVYLLFA